MTDLDKMFQEDSAMAEMPTADEMTNLNRLVIRQLALEEELTRVSVYTKTIQERLRNIQESVIPDLMASTGIKTFTLDSGVTVNIKEDVRASMRADKIEQCVAWLDKLGIGDIVKDEVKVNFGRGEINRVTALLEFCADQGYNAAEKKSVHHSTLKAAVREQLSKGVEFPEEFFSIQPLTKAVLKTK